MTAKQNAIRAIYIQVSAPGWAATNLDALADVLRDLSWLPDGVVPIILPDLDEVLDAERDALLRVLAQAVTDSVDSERPIRVISGR